MNKAAVITGLSALMVGIGAGHMIKGKGGSCPFSGKQPEPVTASAVEKPAADKSKNEAKPHKNPLGYSLYPDKIDFGRMHEGQGKNIEVKFSHPGKEDIRIARIYTSCPCLSVSADKMIIPKDKDGKLELKLHTLTAVGDKTFNYYVELLKPKKEIIKGSVKAKVKRVPSQVMLEPAKCHFGNIIDRKKKSIKLWNLTKSPIHIKIADTGGLNIEALEKNGTVFPGQPIELKVKADPTKLNAGSLRGKIKITTNLDMHSELIIPFDGTVKKQ
jgi:hypothetical protein